MISAQGFTQSWLVDSILSFFTPVSANSWVALALSRVYTVAAL